MIGASTFTFEEELQEEALIARSPERACPESSFRLEDPPFQQEAPQGSVVAVCAENDAGGSGDGSGGTGGFPTGTSESPPEAGTPGIPGESPKLHSSSAASADNLVGRGSTQDPLPTMPSPGTGAADDASPQQHADSLSRAGNEVLVAAGRAHQELLLTLADRAGTKPSPETSIVRRLDQSFNTEDGLPPPDEASSVPQMLPRQQSAENCGPASPKSPKTYRPGPSRDYDQVDAAGFTPTVQICPPPDRPLSAFAGGLATTSPPRQQMTRPLVLRRSLQPSDRAQSPSDWRQASGALEGERRRHTLGAIRKSSGRNKEGRTTNENDAGVLAMEAKLHEALSSFQFEHQVIRIDANRRLYSFGNDVRAVVSMTPEGQLMASPDGLQPMSIGTFLASISSSGASTAAVPTPQRSSTQLERAARGGPLHAGHSGVSGSGVDGGGGNSLTAHAMTAPGSGISVLGATGSIVNPPGQRSPRSAAGAALSSGAAAPAQTAPGGASASCRSGTSSPLPAHPSNPNVTGSVDLPTRGRAAAVPARGVSHGHSARSGSPTIKNSAVSQPRVADPGSVAMHPGTFLSHSRSSPPVGAAAVSPSRVCDPTRARQKGSAKDTQMNMQQRGRRIGTYGPSSPARRSGAAGLSATAASSATTAPGIASVAGNIVPIIRHTGVDVEHEQHLTGCSAVTRASSAPPGASSGAQTPIASMIPGGSQRITAPTSGAATPVHRLSPRANSPGDSSTSPPPVQIRTAADCAAAMTSSMVSGFPVPQTTSTTTTTPRRSSGSSPVRPAETAPHHASGFAAAPPAPPATTATRPQGTRHTIGHSPVWRVSGLPPTVATASAPSPRTSLGSSAAPVAVVRGSTPPPVPPGGGPARGSFGIATGSRGQVRPPSMATPSTSMGAPLASGRSNVNASPMFVRAPTGNGGTWAGSECRVASGSPLRGAALLQSVPAGGVMRLHSTG